MMVLTKTTAMSTKMVTFYAPPTRDLPLAIGYADWLPKATYNPTGGKTPCKTPS